MTRTTTPRAAGLLGLGAACSPKPTASAASQAAVHTAPAGGILPAPRAAPAASDLAESAALGNFELTMLQMVNHLRESLGFAPLAHDPDLALVARRWSQEMAATEKFEHNNDYSSQYPLGWRRAAENIALVGASTAVTADSIQRLVAMSFDNLVESPGHYANMINPNYTHIGIGMAHNSSTLWTTQNFAEYPPETDRGTE